jgi:hypothetical protein
MGFSQADWQEQHGININLDRVRFGHRIPPKKQLNVALLGPATPEADPSQCLRAPASSARDPPR